MADESWQCFHKDIMDLLQDGQALHVTLVKELIKAQLSF